MVSVFVNSGKQGKFPVLDDVGESGKSVSPMLHGWKSASAGEVIMFFERCRYVLAKRESRALVSSRDHWERPP